MKKGKKIIIKRVKKTQINGKLSKNLKQAFLWPINI